MQAGTPPASSEGQPGCLRPRSVPESEGSVLRGGGAEADHLCSRAAPPGQPGLPSQSSAPTNGASLWGSPRCLLFVWQHARNQLSNAAVLRPRSNGYALGMSVSKKEGALHFGGKTTFDSRAQAELTHKPGQHAALQPCNKSLVPPHRAHAFPWPCPRPWAADSSDRRVPYSPKRLPHTQESSQPPAKPQRQRAPPGQPTHGHSRGDPTRGTGRGRPAALTRARVAVVVAAVPGAPASSVAVAAPVAPILSPAAADTRGVPALAAPLRAAPAGPGPQPPQQPQAQRSAQRHGAHIPDDRHRHPVARGGLGRRAGGGAGGWRPGRLCPALPCPALPAPTAAGAVQSGGIWEVWDWSSCCWRVKRSIELRRDVQHRDVLCSHDPA